MAQLLSRHGVRTHAQRVTAYNGRERRRGVADPARSLFRTHTFHDGDTIAPGDSFPDRTRPATFAISVVRTDTGSNGLLFELGTVTHGLAVALNGPDLIVAAGGAVAGDDGVDYTVVDGLPGLQRRYDIVFGILPGAGRVNVWLNGKLVGAGFSVDEAFPEDGWSSDDDGSLGGLIDNVTLRIPVLQAVELSDAVLVSPLSVYQGQLPRQFKHFGLGVDQGAGSWISELAL